MVFREAGALKNLNHKNIVKIINFYTLKNMMQVVFVMEYLEGGELLNYIKMKQLLTEKEAHFLFMQIIDAISYCHNEKIIHRDLKLENLMFSDLQNKHLKVIKYYKTLLYKNRLLILE